MVKAISSIAVKKVESIREVPKESATESSKELSPLRTSMETIENTSFESLKLQNESRITEITNRLKQIEMEGDVSNETNSGLTEEEKQLIKDESGWSDEIIDQIGSMEEYEVYKETGNPEDEINGKRCLVRSDIDWNQKDSMGRTNKERAEAGLSPINKDGNKIELHHIGQKSDGSLAELTPDEHRGKDNYSVLHDAQKESEIDRPAFDRERKEHWEESAKTGVWNA